MNKNTVNKINTISKISKKKVWIAITSTLLAITSITLVTIVATVSLTSNDDKWAVKKAKNALKKLTNNQKTVNLTKTTNQKLSSEISSRITSMDTLDDLIKGVIIVPNDVTYILQVLDTNDIKGELVVEITIKKGAFIDTFKFIVTRFKKLSKAQIINKTTIEDYQKLIKKITEAKTTQKTSLASKVKYASVNEFNSKTNVTLALPPQDIKVKIIFRDYMLTLEHVGIEHVDKNGRQFVVFEITKGTMTKWHSIIVTGFKQWSKIDKAAIDNYQKLIYNTAIVTTTQKTKIPSSVEYTNVEDFNLKTSASLPLPPKDIKVKIINVNNESINKNGKQNVVFEITKGDAIVEHVIEVTGFKKTITQADKDDKIAIDNYKKLIDHTIPITTTQKTKSAGSVEYKNVEDFNFKTSASFPLPPMGIKVKVHVRFYSVENSDGHQGVIFIISKGFQVVHTALIRVTGFRE